MTRKQRESGELRQARVICFISPLKKILSVSRRALFGIAASD